MNKELEHLWGKLSLTEKEQTDVVIEKDWLEEGEEVGKRCLVGKLVLNKRVNVETMKNVFSNVKEVGKIMLVFHFEDIMYKKRVLMRKPLSFNKSLLILASFDGQSKPEEVNLQWCTFWIQIHGLPLGLMIENIGAVLGESMGDVEEVDAKGDQMA